MMRATVDSCSMCNIKAANVENKGRSVLFVHKKNLQCLESTKCQIKSKLLMRQRRTIHPDVRIWTKMTKHFDISSQHFHHLASFGKNGISSANRKVGLCLHVVGPTGVPYPETDLSTLGNSHSANGSYTAGMHNFIRRYTLRLLSFPYILKLNPLSLFLFLFTLTLIYIFFNNY